MYERIQHSDRKIWYNQAQYSWGGYADCRTSFQTIEYTKCVVEIINSTYVKSDIKQVANNSTHLNDE